MGKSENNMGKNKIDPIPKGASYDEIAKFWGTHSLADYWDQTEPAEFEIDPNARQRHLVSLDPGLLQRIRNIARKRGLATESAVNLFLEQRLHQIEQDEQHPSPTPLGQ